MPSVTPIEVAASVLFALAVLHTFCTRFFEGLALRQPSHAGVWHLLGEVEVVFGFWALVLMVVIFAFQGSAQATDYLDSRNFTEPMFVFAVMVVAGTRPVLLLAGRGVALAARLLPLPRPLASYWLLLAAAPLLGSFITEPAAMTLAALMLRDLVFNRPVSSRLKYATLGVLFVNVSIGGTLTPFAAPPVLMVASAWQWDMGFMLSHFGWKAALAVALNASGAALLFQREIVAHGGSAEAGARVPAAVTLVHLLFLVGVVVFAHHPPMFLGLLLFFLGFATAYERHQNPLILREALLVALFLAGLVVLGGFQRWWLQPLLLAMDDRAVYYGATALTAITDNAALTYLASLVPGLDPDFKIAVVAGAVTGGGLTVIANAPNPAGLSILRGHFDDQAVNPGGLFVAALAPTLVAICAFRLL